MENTENLRSELFTYVKENTFKETESLTSDTMLFVEGVFDSMGFVLLLDFLEEKFQVVANDNELIEENFESIDAIAAYVLKKSSAVVQ